MRESSADVLSTVVGGVEALTIKEATNIVIGIQNAAPEAWVTTMTAVQVGGTGAIRSTTAQGCW
jgi:frataxin-like iron-binding protein CyaY